MNNYNRFVNRILLPNQQHRAQEMQSEHQRELARQQRSDAIMHRLEQLSEEKAQGYRNQLQAQVRELEAKKRLNMVEKQTQKMQMEDYMGEVRQIENLLKKERFSKVQNYRSVLESQKRGVTEPLQSHPSVVSMESPGRSPGRQNSE